MEKTTGEKKYMTIVKKPYIITDIIEMKNSDHYDLPIPIPSMKVFHIHAVYKKWVEESMKGREKLDEMGLKEHIDTLEQDYMESYTAFTAIVPATEKTIEWNRYHVGGIINIAYYPENEVIPDGE